MSSAVIPKKYWGPAGWQWGHLRAIYYPKKPTIEDKRLAISDVRTFASNLPCDECKGHASDYIEKNPMDVSGTAAFQLWWFHFHNAVNKRLGKPVITFAAYEKLYAKHIEQAHGA